MAYEVVDFDREVIEASFEIPVLVDFWAPWCGPCRVLGPVLEKLAGENGGRWKLAKLNTDERQDLAQQYGIRGIPAVKLFVDGRVHNEFTGALPEHMLKKWLEEALPTEETMQLAAATAAMEAGQTKTALHILESLIAASPDEKPVRLMLAQLVAQTDVEKAEKLLDGFDEADVLANPEIDSIRTLSRLAHIGEQSESLPDDPGKDDYLEAAIAVKNADWDRALHLFISVIQQNRYYDDDGSRKACIAIFNIIGAGHELTRKHRRMFDMVLY